MMGLVGFFGQELSWTSNSLGPFAMAEPPDDTKKDVYPNLYISQFSLRNSEKQSEFIVTRTIYPLSENTFITNLKLGLVLFSSAGLIQS